jgi:hypothetical protein
LRRFLSPSRFVIGNKFSESVSVAQARSPPEINNPLTTAHLDPYHRF